MIAKGVLSMIESCSVRAVLVVAVGLAGSLFGQHGFAATHSVPVSTSLVDCDSYGGGVRPGDILILKGPVRRVVTFRDCRGTASQPIQIRNDTSASAPLVIEYSGSGFQSRCTNCEYVVWDGSGKWAGAPDGTCGVSATDGYRTLGSSQCGIVFRCTSGGPHSAINFNGSSRNFAFKGVEIDGNYPTCSSGTGLSINDHGYELADHPGEWREGIQLLGNYIHDVPGSAIYFGPNVNPEKGGGGDLPLRNNEIAYNYIDRPGCDGIKYKNAIAGRSQIHHNYVVNTGQNSAGPDTGCTSAGIILFESGYTDVFANYVESPAPVSTGAGVCINQYSVYQPSSVTAQLPARIFNNVVRNCKGAGIAVGRGNESAAPPAPSIYNNTVVAPIGKSAISVGSGIATCDIRDNIVAGSRISASGCTMSRNIVDSVEAHKFQDSISRDFRLSKSSPAVDAGGTSCPSEDILGVRRPNNGVCDVGAFEFTNEDELARPKPPSVVIVE